LGESRGGGEDLAPNDPWVIGLLELSRAGSDTVREVIAQVEGGNLVMSDGTSSVTFIGITNPNAIVDDLSFF
jgi:hypothetical protein